MDIFFKFVNENIKPHWDKPYSGFLLSIAAGVTIYMWAISTGTNQISSLECIAIILGTLIPISFWGLTHQIPKVKKGKIGIVLSLISENTQDAKKIESDFIYYLRQSLHIDPQKGNFELVVLPNFAARLAIDNKAANKIRFKTRAHFMIYGRVRKRVINNKDVYVLDLDGLVRHSPVSLDLSKELAHDFRQIIPKKLLIDCDGDTISFEVTSSWMDIAARYVIAVAAYFSGAVAYSEKLLLEVENRLSSSKEIPPYIQAIARNLPIWIKRLYHDWCVFLYDQFLTTKNIEVIKTIDEISDKLLYRDPENYNGRNIKAIAHVILRKDTESAHKLMDKCSSKRDKTWLFNKAFLYAYEGNLLKSHESYKQAFRGYWENVTVPLQCEAFILDILKLEPNKTEFHFCLGLINYNAKKDYNSSIRDFTNFITLTDPNKYKAEKNVAEKLIKSCERKLNKTDIK